MHRSWKIILWLGVASSAWLIGYWWTSNFSLELSWVRTIYKSKVDIANALENERRILVVGGSGSHMGLDTNIISEKLGMPTINFGLHAALGIEAILSSVEPNIQAGDIVLLIPEYDIISDEDGVGRLAGQFGLLSGTLGHMNVSWEEKVRSLLKVGNPSLKSLYGSGLKVYQGEPARDYSRDYYTSEVDTLGNPTELKVKDPQPKELQNRPSSHAIQRLEEFKFYVEGQGASLIIGLPWVLVQGSQASRNTAISFINEYKKLAPVIHENDYNLKTDAKLFGDTIYHLNSEGLKKRSEAISEQLRDILDE